MPIIKNLDTILIQSIMILFLFMLAAGIYQIFRTAKLEKRFKKFSFDSFSNKEKENSIFDKIKNIYFALRDALTKRLIKIRIFDEYSKKYMKYCSGAKITKEDRMNYISNKIFVGFAICILILVSDFIQIKKVTIYQTILAFLLGFFSIDIILIIDEKIKKKNIEKDMIKAIIIMNNAFKSGLSIMQAIYLVSNELEGPISEEFRKMYVDLTFGLSMETVFERFTKRVDIKEAHYITTSLNVLNKTGGNIVQVFASVERNAFNRKKLEEELGALAASSKAIYRILIFIPIFLFGGIFLLNPEYFNPLITDPIGIMISFVIVIIYILYIIIIKKIVKVKVEV